MLRWLFLDMNSYFASVEQELCPAWRGRSLAVVPVETDFTCCIAVSREAKAAGIRTGTSVSEARQRCPQVVIVKARPEVYVRVHHDILRAIDRHAPVEKVYSIDEVAIRLGAGQRQARSARDLGQRIKQQICADAGSCLTSSVGIAATRLLAKTACEMHKPDGMVVLEADALPGALLDLPLDALPGIGRNMLRRLHAHGIQTTEALWALSRSEVVRIWGSVQGDHWWCGLHGIDAPEPATHRHSMGHANVLAPELRHDEGAHGIMVRLLHKAAHRLRHHGYFAHHLHASIRYTSGRQWRDDIGMPACRDTLTILEHFQRLWDRRHAAGVTLDDVPKQVAVTLTHLTKADNTPGCLFPESQRRDRLAQVIDRANHMFGRHSLYFAGMHHVRHDMDDKIAFGRVPDEAGRM